MAFPLAAIGAGIGQFAQDYRQQQQEQIRTMMLQMQLADYKRKMDAETRANAAADLSLDWHSGAGGGTQQAPVQGLPQVGGGSQGWLTTAAPPGSGRFTDGGGMRAGGALTGGSIHDPRNLVPYIRETASKYGIDPDVAVQVARSEGLANPFGDGGKSGGAFQLYTGGGVGNEFQRDTGKSPLDLANERETIDYALRRASQVGWGPWHGAKRVGIGEWQGIGRGRPAAGSDLAAGTGQFAMPTGAAAGLGAPRPTGPPDTLVARAGPEGRPTSPIPGPVWFPQPDAPDQGQPLTIPPAAPTDYSRPPPTVAPPPGAARGAPAAAVGRAPEPQAPRAPATATPQMAQAGPPPEEPVPPMKWQEIGRQMRAKNPNVPTRTIVEAAQDAAGKLQAQYKIELERYKVQFDRWKTGASLAGEAESRAQTRAHQTEMERQGRATLDREERSLDERIAAGTATREDMERKAYLEEKRLALDVRTQGDLKADRERGREIEQGRLDAELARIKEMERAGTATDKDRARGRELEEGRLKVSQQAQQGVAQRFAEKAAATKRKADTEMQLVRNLIHEAETLAQIVQSNPSVVGGRGVVGRVGGSIAEQTGPIGQAIGRAVGVGGPNYKVQTDFQNRLQTLQSKLSKELIQVRQFSGPAQARLNALLPGLAALEGPSSAAGALRNIASHLQQNLAAMEQASSVTATDVESLSQGDALKELGFGAPAGQQ